MQFNDFLDFLKFTQTFCRNELRNFVNTHEKFEILCYKKCYSFFLGVLTKRT